MIGRLWEVRFPLCPIPGKCCSACWLEYPPNSIPTHSLGDILSLINILNIRVIFPGIQPLHFRTNFRLFLIILCTERRYRSLAFLFLECGLRRGRCGYWGWNFGFLLFRKQCLDPIFPLRYGLDEGRWFCAYFSNFFRNLIARVIWKIKLAREIDCVRTHHSRGEDSSWYDLTISVSLGFHDCDEVSSHVLKASSLDRITGCLSCNQLNSELASVVTIVKVHNGSLRPSIRKGHDYGEGNLG